MSDGKRFIPIAKPWMDERESQAARRPILSGWVTQGPEVAAFEREFASFVGVKHAVAVSSGTAALHLMMLGLGAGEGDEIITSPFSFVASANCALYVGARPIFVDVAPHTLNLDPALVESAITGRTAGVLAVHVFGLVADMPAIQRVADRFGLGVLEDACEALGARLEGRMAGAWSRAAAFGFYPNKQMTTGEGGMIVTDEDDLAVLFRSLRNQGRSERAGWLEHDRLGYNYRMSEMTAALGRAQLARLPEMIERRRTVARVYAELLGDVSEVTPLGPPEDERRSWFVYVVRLAEGVDRDNAVSELARRGIQSRAYFPPIHLMPAYRERFGYAPGDFPVTEAVSRTTIALPFHPLLTREDITFVVEALRDILA